MHAVFRPSQDGESENPRVTKSADALLTLPKALSFGDFSLCQQRKVTRPAGTEALHLEAKQSHWIPAFAGMTSNQQSHWIPAFAAMTSKVNVDGSLLPQG